MATFDYLGTRETADGLIKKFGMAAVLRRASVDRDCWVVVVDEMPSDKSTQLANPTDRKILMSAVGLDQEPPNNEFDQLVTFVQPPAPVPVENEVLPMTCPVKKYAPAGVTVLYEFTVRR